MSQQKNATLPVRGRSRWIGVLALAATVVLWSSFALSTRAIGQSSLTEVDVVLLRFATPALVLAPRWRRAARELRTERPGVLLPLLVGGLPYLLLFALGARLTSAGLTGMVVPGTIPLFVTGLAFLVWRERVSQQALLALGVIVVGVAVSSTQVPPGSGDIGLGVLLVAGLAWAVYTLGLRSTSLSPLSAVIVICAMSATVAGALALIGIMPSHLLHGEARARDVLLFVLVQGVGTGLLSTLFYAVAVQRLGSGTAAAAGAISPVLTALAAAAMFGEPLTLGLMTSLLLIVTGVVVFNRVTSRATCGLLRWRRREAGGRLITAPKTPTPTWHVDPHTPPGRWVAP